jgi:hypothetical protein
MSPATSAAEKQRPLQTYSIFMGAFSSLFGGAVALAGAKGRLPERPPLADVVLAGIAGHKLARLIATDEVTAPIRAPFVFARVKNGDVLEEPTGTGVRRAFGELLTCPSCVGQWTCAAFVAGMLHSPRATRAVASLFAADTVSDFLHVAYRASKDRA